MRFLKRFSLLTILAVLIPVAAQAQDVPDEQFFLQQDISGKKNIGVIFFNESIRALSPSLLFAFKSDEFEDSTSICKSIKDIGCKNSPKLGFDAHLAPCINEGDVDCIEGLFANKDQDDVAVSGVFQELIPKIQANEFLGDKRSELPTGSSSGIWRIPGVIHQGGTDEYAVVAIKSGILVNKNGRFNPSELAIGSFARSQLQVAIYPVTKVNKPNLRKIAIEFRKTATRGSSLSTIFSNGSDGCVLVDDGLCALRNGFPEGIDFGVKVRLSRQVNGWLHGRINEPVIDLTKSTNSTSIEISGRPMNVPVVSGWVPLEKFSKADQKSLGLKSSDEGSYRTTSSSGLYAMQKLEIWNRLLGDKATAYPSEWLFYTLSESELEGSNSCIANAKGLAGMVTSNSTTYTGGPPTFSSKTQSLDYKIASPHYLKDGSVFEGRYNLSITSKVARCIYKFSNAPISASVSVVGGSGESRVATTAVSERKGWINLSVNGFTFSSPTVKVKLKQKK